MLVNSSSNKISFKKELVAKTSLCSKKEGEVPCSIYRLEEDIDKHYFFKINNFQDWDSADYFSFMAYSTSILNALCHDDKDFYVLENNDGDCLSCAQVSKSKNNYTLDIIETVPKYTNPYSKRNSSPIKYIGQTMVAFLAKLAQKNEKEYIRVISTIDTKPYYTDVCFFDEDPLVLYSRKFSELIEKNEENTNSKIELVI
ncbi:hypothetical protein IJD44_04110 [bacterium]|nr:hypothetical protein [bacterium]